MLIKCCILPSRSIKSVKAAPAGGAHSALPDPLARFKPVLYLVVFFISLNSMRYIVIPSLLNEDLPTPIGQKMI